MTDVAPDRAAAPPRVLVFDLPLPENLGNGRMHWRTKYSHRKRYLAMLDTRVLVKWLPRPPAQPFAKAHADVEVRTFRIMDRDNAAARCKDAIDWLKTRGYIVNDDPAHLALDVTPVAAPLSACGIVVRLLEVVG